MEKKELSRLSQYVAYVELWSGRLYRFIFDSEKDLGDPILHSEAALEWNLRHATAILPKHVKRIVPRCQVSL